MLKKIFEWLHVDEELVLRWTPEGLSVRLYENICGQQYCVSHIISPSERLAFDDIMCECLLVKMRREMQVVKDQCLKPDVLEKRKNRFKNHIQG